MRRKITSLIVGALLLPVSAWALTFEIPENSDVVGEVQIIETNYKDTFVDLSREYDVGYYEIVDANPGVDPWMPGEGTRIVIPTQYIIPPVAREGIVINLAELRLYYFDPENNTVTTHPVSIGSEFWPTPTMLNEKIIDKKKDPAWHVPKSIQREYEAAGQEAPTVVPPGPDNPLGRYMLRTSKPGYLIHSTNTPVGLGRRVTHGCIRMYPEDIEVLFPRVPVGARVQIIHEPVKVGWLDDRLYIEMHKPLDGYDSQEDKLIPNIMKMVDAKSNGEDYTIDWGLVKRLSNSYPGMPQQVGERD